MASTAGPHAPRPRPGSRNSILPDLGDRFPRHLSGGQRKRVALAQVLALKPKLILMDEPFASLDAIVRARVVKDLVALVERERISVLLVTHDLEEALSLSDEIYLLSQGPRAHITQHYTVPIPRPRDPVRSRMHPAFAPLYEKIWADLSREVELAGGGGMMPGAARYSWVRQVVALPILLALWEAAGRAGMLNPLYLPSPSQIGAALVRPFLRRPYLAAS